MSDHVSLMGSITNSRIEVASWGDGCMDLLDFKNFLEGFGGEDVDLNMSLETHNTLVASSIPVLATSSRAS
jgi:hypothetical protein